MTRSRVIILSAAAFVSGCLVTFVISQYFFVTFDFPRVMILRSAVDKWPTPAVPLELLDLYELEVNRQDVWFAFSNLTWTQQRIEINLRRYITHLNLHQSDLAERDVARAAVLRKRGSTVNAQDLDVERQLAMKLYGTKPASLP